MGSWCGAEDPEPSRHLAKGLVYKKTLDEIVWLWCTHLEDRKLKLWFRTSLMLMASPRKHRSFYR